MSIRAGGAEDMFLDVKDLAVRKVRIRKSYAPGSIDYGISEVKQAGPLEVNASAELLEGQIRIVGELETKIEMVCARCLEPVIEEIHRDFDLFYQPLPKGTRHEPERMRAGDTGVGLFGGESVVVVDVVNEEVVVLSMMKV